MRGEGKDLLGPGNVAPIDVARDGIDEARRRQPGRRDAQRSPGRVAEHGQIRRRGRVGPWEHWEIATRAGVESQQREIDLRIETHDRCGYPPPTMVDNRRRALPRNDVRAGDHVAGRGDEAAREGESFIGIEREQA